MHVYFVRHGETALNPLHRHQSPGTPLSPRGREQAMNVAEYLRTVNPDLLITSEYTRAKETAQVIGMHIGMSPVTNELFYEIVRPSSLFGLSHFHPKTFWYVILTFLRRYNAQWRFEDAENFSDIEKRVQKALTYLASLQATHASVVVISHTVFINSMVSYMHHQKLGSVVGAVGQVRHIIQMNNTDIIHAECTNDSEHMSCTWKVVNGYTDTSL